MTDNPHHNDNWVRYEDQYQEFLNNIVGLLGTFIKGPVTPQEWQQIRRWSTPHLLYALSEYDRIIESCLFYGNAYNLKWVLPLARKYREKIEAELERRATPKIKANTQTKMTNFLQAEEVRRGVDMLDVYAQLLDLEVKRHDGWAICPFHKNGAEHTGSLIVHLDEGTWHCFGCQRGGDVFTFIMTLENCDFPTAVKRVSELGHYVKPERKSDATGSAVAMFQGKLQG